MKDSIRCQKWKFVQDVQSTKQLFYCDAMWCVLLMECWFEGFEVREGDTVLGNLLALRMLCLSVCTVKNGRVRRKNGVLASMEDLDRLHDQLSLTKPKSIKVLHLRWETPPSFCVSMMAKGESDTFLILLAIFFTCLRGTSTEFISCHKSWQGWAKAEALHSYDMNRCSRQPEDFESQRLSVEDSSGFI